MKLCTTKQAADKLGATSRTILLWSQSGLLKSWKTPGGHRRFSLAEVEDLAINLEEKSKLSQKIELEKSKLKILVVEDDSYLLNLYSLNISSWNLPLELELSHDGYDGLYKAGSFNPDLLILDLDLPNVNGLQIIATLIKNNGINFDNILIVTGLSRSEISNDFVNTEKMTIIKKPIKFDFIKKIIEKKLGEKLSVSTSI